MLFNILHDAIRLVIGGIILDIIHLIALFVVRPEHLILSSVVMTNHAVGDGQDVLRGAVVLLQLRHGSAGKRFFKIQDIRDIRAAELVNGLVVVTDHAQVSVLLRQQTTRS